MYCTSLSAPKPNYIETKPYTQAEYPTSTRHFLLIGFLGMFVGSIVFCYLAMKKKTNNVREKPKQPQTLNDLFLPPGH